MTALLTDLGGTNARFELHDLSVVSDSDSPDAAAVDPAEDRLLLAKTYATSSAGGGGFQALVSRFASECAAAALPPPHVACMAVCGACTNAET